MRLASSTVLVTGGASSLGAATAALFSESGAQVVIVDLPTSAGADATRLGPKVRCAAADVRDQAAIKAVLAVVRDDMKSLDANHPSTYACRPRSWRTRC